MVFFTEQFYDNKEVFAIFLPGGSDNMFEINLIKEKLPLFEKRKMYIHLFTGVYALSAVVFIAVFAYFAVVTVEVDRLNKLELKIKTAIEEIRDNIEIRELKKKWTKYYYKMNTINSIIDQRSLWACRLQELSSIIPSGIYINKMSVKNNLCTVDACKTDDAKSGVIDLIRLIKQNKFFSADVKLESRERTTLKKKDVVLFRITINFSRPHEM